MRVAIDSARQDRRLWRHERRYVGGAAAEKTLITAMAGAVLRRRALVLDMDAELRRFAEDRLKLGGDRRIIGAGESG